MLFSWYPLENRQSPVPSLWGNFGSYLERAACPSPLMDTNSALWLSLPAPGSALPGQSYPQTVPGLCHGQQQHRMPALLFPIKCHLFMCLPPRETLHQHCSRCSYVCLSMFHFWLTQIKPSVILWHLWAAAHTRSDTSLGCSVHH